MCRLLAVKSEKEFKVSEHLKKFAYISEHSKEYQGHGWGLAYLAGDEWKVYKNIKPIWEDDLKRFGSTRFLIAHARSAFRDKGIKVENNMPFFEEPYLFIFNGELEGVKIKEEGRIGAEKIFHFIKRFSKYGMNSALLKAVPIIKKRTGYIKAMNIVIADKESIYLSTLFNERPSYFTMHHKRINGDLMVCSEPYPGEEGWLKVKNDTIMELK